MNERPLTTRQHVILREIARGATNKEIAAGLGISEQGVKAHVSRLLERFGADNRVALVALTRAWADREDRAYERLAHDVDIVRSRLSGAPGDVAAAATAPPLSGDPSTSADVVVAISQLNQLLSEVNIAMKLASEIPHDATTAPLLEAVRTRVTAALAETGRLANLIERQQASNAAPTRKRAT